MDSAGMTFKLRDMERCSTEEYCIDMLARGHQKIPGTTEGFQIDLTRDLLAHLAEREQKRKKLLDTIKGSWEIKVPSFPGGTLNVAGLCTALESPAFGRAIKDVILHDEQQLYERRREMLERWANGR